MGFTSSQFSPVTWLVVGSGVSGLIRLILGPPPSGHTMSHISFISSISSIPQNPSLLFFFCVQFHSTEIWNAKTLTQKHRSFARFALYSLLTQTWHEWKPLTQQHGYFHGFPGISPSTRTIDLIDLMSHRNFETTKISENQSENQVVKEKQVITVINEWSTSRRCNPSPACSSKCPTTSTNST